MKFRRHSDVDWENRGSGSRLEAASLPDSEKEKLCRDLLAEFGVTDIRQSGDELQHACLLPFSDHRDQERNPTGSLNFRKLAYKCVGTCDAGGGLLWFIGIMRDESGESARKWLRGKTGLGEEESLASLMDFFDAIYTNGSKANQYGPMPHMSTDVLEPWLQHPDVVIDYMGIMRNMPPDLAERAIEKFKIGYAPDMRIRIGENKFVKSHRIVIPHFWRGNLVGWQTRRMFDDMTMKYKNSPDFPKDQTLYNYDRNAESAFSVIAKDHTGDHIESTFSASITDRQLKLISMHPKVVIFGDNDAAGWNMTHRLGGFLERYSAVNVADNPYAADPADMDDQTYRQCVDGALPYSIWSPPKELIPWASESTPSEIS
jgi:hypothetical protein